MTEDLDEFLRRRIQILEGPPRSTLWATTSEIGQLAQRRRLRQRHVAMAVTAITIVVLAASVLVPLSNLGGGGSRTPLRLTVIDHSGSAVELGANAPAAAIGVGGTLEQTVAKAEQHFSLSLLRELETQSSGSNVVSSPSSLFIALSMLELGAAGSTEQQIAKALETTGLSPPEQAAGLQALVADQMVAAKRAGIAFESANGLWTQRGLAMNASFMSLLSRYFGSGIWQVDFRNDPAAAAAALNSWAAAQTAGLINQLFPPGVVGSNTDVVLADAGYFKAQWAQPFDAGFSSALPFYVDGRQAQPTAFMNVAEPISVPAEESNGLDEVELPYTGGRFAALVIMPTEQTLPSFLSSLSADSLQRMVDSLQMTSVALQMPRFELSETADENGALRALGILDAFGAADLSNMTPAPGLSVQRVQQSTVLRVTPEGTEAASATGVAIGTALRAATLTITIDHPFLLLVRDTVTNAILFGALIENPTT